MQQRNKLIIVDSKDNLQDPNVRAEAISGTNLFGYKGSTEDYAEEYVQKEENDGRSKLLKSQA